MSHALLSVALVAVLGAFTHPAWGQSRDGRDWSREKARAVPDWVRDAVVYEVFPRAFSPEGNLAGVTARLDLTPAFPLPQQPGSGTPERKARKVELPSLGLDAWGVRVFRR